MKTVTLDTAKRLIELGFEGETYWRKDKQIKPPDHFELVQWIKERGEWEAFIEWHREEIANVFTANVLVEYTSFDSLFYCTTIGSADILTNVELLAQAYIAWREHE